MQFDRFNPLPYIFGKTVDEIVDLQDQGYDPASYYENNPVLKRAIDALSDGSFCPHNPRLLKPVADDLIHRDQFMALADFDSYRAAQRKISEDLRKPQIWWKKSVLNTARLGRFSSDRSIRDYAEKVWDQK